MLPLIRKEELNYQKKVLFYLIKNWNIKKIKLNQFRNLISTDVLKIKIQILILSSQNKFTRRKFYLQSQTSLKEKERKKVKMKEIGKRKEK